MNNTEPTLTPAERLQARALLVLSGYKTEEIDRIMVEVEEKFRKRMEELSA